MEHSEHCRVDRFFYNQPYPEIHKWLDELFDAVLLTHWKERHHLEAIQEKYGLYTTEYNVAYLHILCDWMSHCTIATVPKNKQEVIDLIKEAY